MGAPWTPGGVNWSGLQVVQHSVSLYTGLSVFLNYAGTNSYVWRDSGGQGISWGVGHSIVK